MAFTAKDVATLRAKTNCGMMDCKKALTEADGDMEKAAEILREKGLAASVKKAGRIAAEGVVLAKVENGVGAVVEVNAETDFVAKNAMFQEFVNGVLDTIIKENPADVEDLLTKKINDKYTVDEELKNNILTIGENMKIRRFVRYEGGVTAYVHGGGRIGVLVQFTGDDAVINNPAFAEVGKDVAMQIAALNPSYLNPESVPAEDLEKEKEILLAQIANDPKNAKKPDAVKEKMVTGRINKFYELNTLTNQAFVKDGNMSVKAYVDAEAKKLGGSVVIAGFTRFEKGEGLEKKEENFADEIAKMVK
ncbi:MAG: translation elongation factor Ts [Eubacteriales bacterium]